MLRDPGEIISTASSTSDATSRLSPAPTRVTTRSGTRTIGGHSARTTTSTPHHDLDVEEEIPPGGQLVVELPGEPIGGLLMPGSEPRRHQQDAFLELVPVGIVLR